MVERAIKDYMRPLLLNSFQLTYVQLVLKKSSLVGDAFKVNILVERKGLSRVIYMIMKPLENNS